MFVGRIQQEDEASRREAAGEDREESAGLRESTTEAVMRGNEQRVSINVARNKLRNDYLSNSLQKVRRAVLQANHGVRGI